ncbi:MAG: pantoate--beta-alanine ligase [Saprospiraceae bacterium]|nr:pantoate--beta-alanine ligase [Saprospiraceae bacterium]
MIPICTTVDGYKARRSIFKSEGHRIALVPTLGALHDGHLKLMEHAQKLADRLVVSIFVNPKQFNDEEDLIKYPRPLQQDIHLLNQLGIDLLFLPSSAEMYPAGHAETIDVELSHLTSPLEGRYRPGHFDGVIAVVHRLLDIIEPDFLVMGQKDYQQLTIIREMIKRLGLPVDLVAHPTIREADGLAMSSRNVRLSSKARKQAPAIYRILQKAKALKDQYSPAEAVAKCIIELDERIFRVDYFKIVDTDSLKPLTSWRMQGKNLVCVAAWLGDVRLIDNIIV